MVRIGHKAALRRERWKLALFFFGPMAIGLWCSMPGSFEWLKKTFPMYKHFDALPAAPTTEYALDVEKAKDGLRKLQEDEEKKQQ
eukprot:CAMPEP_0119140714 /NCGR_PEP_ID=MMETSP1310-20130426/29728_1 /TAXON_ID=464262 /ORGANISM="Genus nov. species nov., Strain RCC2339" /LENGTH=84 /DNA_ID=CAMNT_0007132093 /DNA_START=33 /DNA_END=287 /DNA_ORIENTATION=-